MGSRGTQSPGLPWLIAAGGGAREGAPAAAPSPALQSSSCGSSGSAASLRPGPAWCPALRGGEQATRPGPRCQGAGRGAGLPTPRRLGSPAPAAAPAAPPAIVMRRPDAGVRRPSGECPGAWPSGRSSQTVRPSLASRIPAGNGFWASRWRRAKIALPQSSSVEVTLRAQTRVGS